MRILVTGAKGFVGKNLCAQLNAIKDGKDRRFPELKIEEIFEYDIDTDPALLDTFCKEADFVFNLAGVNRPKENSEFMTGNFGFASTLLDTLKKWGNKCPVMLSSSQQASLTGRFGNSEYGRSKKAGEDLFLEYERDFLKANTNDTNLTNNSCNSSDSCSNNPRVLIYRFPNLFGKWCRPNYNSAVATFCNNIANDLPYTVNDPSVELELLYIDDLVEEMISALQGQEHRCEFNGLDVVPTSTDLSFSLAQRKELKETSTLTKASPYMERMQTEDCRDRQSSVGSGKSGRDLDCSIGRYCYCPITHHVTLGRIVELLKEFAEQPKTLMIPEIPEGSFAKKLYSTYLSYLPKEKVAFPLKMNVDDRGSFTELIHTLNCGQVSINISKPGITKGQHWHNTKWEFFIVVAGHGLIQERKICHTDNTDDTDNEILEFEVSGDNIQCIHMLPGYTHNIINLSETENLVTVMYCNEIFNPNKPDTFFEKV